MSENETKTIALPSITTVRDLAKMVNSTPIQVIKVLMANGVMANINQQIDFDTAAVVLAELGFEATLEVIEVEEEQTGEIPLWRRLIEKEDPKNLVARASCDYNSWPCRPWKNHPSRCNSTYQCCRR